MLLRDDFTSTQGVIFNLGATPNNGVKVAEGKNKMSVVNAVKNKLLTRVIAVANKREEYMKNTA